MPEGGVLPWKIQKLNLAPSLSYDSIQKPLLAPKGKRWNYDCTNKEWSLVNHSSAFVVVDAVVVADDNNDKAGNSNVITAEEFSSHFVEHHIRSSDTFQGICLKYKITPLELRRANGFSGQNLELAPNPLKIPHSNYIMATSAEAIPIDKNNNKIQVSLTKNEVIKIIRKECRNISLSEAKAYLMLNDWDLSEALENAKEDGF